MILAAAVVVLAGGGYVYSRFLARQLGEDPTRKTPAVLKADGVDYVPTPTGVVFAHHFASIAGAGPILGPVIAIIYGWGPAVLWVMFGGLLIGAVHDYLATHISTREGGQSIATVARRILGKDAFVALAIMLVIMLALVCAAFLNASAKALTSMLPFARLGLGESQTLFRTVGSGPGQKVVIGGIASMSVIVITAVAPLLGWMYIKKRVPVWLCSLLAIGICGASVWIGLYHPVDFTDLARRVNEATGWNLGPQNVWQILISTYVLIAAGVPVWLFLQSRDFINVHILYVGMIGLIVTLVVAAVRGPSPDVAAAPIPMWNIAEGTKTLGIFWPTLFIVIACGAVSGFHSLCAGGTTCKQITNESAARRIGYYGMLLESFLAVCVIGVMMIGANKGLYIQDVHVAKNWVLGFAMAVGNAAHAAYGVPVAVGAVAGMVLLEGFLVTTLDTAIRLTRYLIEEVWRAIFGRYDLMAESAPATEAAQWAGQEPVPAGTDGIPAAIDPASEAPAPAHPRTSRGPLRGLLLVLKQYWFNSGLAVALMLAFALTGGQAALWKIFATSNQLLAAMGLSLGSLWLLRKGRTFWFALIPGAIMFVTTCTNLVLMFVRWAGAAEKPYTLLIADAVIVTITAYLLACGLREVIRLPRRPEISGS
jgi:carbon starvation protein